jgi:hypothetical protein
MLKPTAIALAFAALVAAGGLIGAPPARAEYKTTTAQALAAHAEWLPYAPPPPNGPAAVCLVDTGVDLNPDTTSNVIARIALDGGDPSDLSDSKHGTQMAMVMGAPINDWGMVGFWPGVQIVSVRASEKGESGFPFVSYTNGLRTCQEHAVDHNVRVIELALSGGTPPTDDERRDFGNAVIRARERGLNVVASGGNGGTETPSPAGFPGVFSVAASKPGGDACFSEQPTPDLRAPGCDLDGADPASGAPTTGAAGSSQASALVSASLAALRSYRPDLTASMAEEILLGSAKGADIPTLNTAASFEGADLALLVAEGAEARAEAAATPTRRVATLRLATPRFRTARRGSLWQVRLRNRPRETLAILRFRDRGGNTVRVLHTMRNNVIVRVPTARTLCVRYRLRRNSGGPAGDGRPRNSRVSRQVCRSHG